MKALSLTQPWASLVACGAKRIETRSWFTRHRGPIAIHAAKGFPRGARDLCSVEPFESALAAAYPERSSIILLPVGCIIARVVLVDCVPTESIRDNLSSNEIEFGNFNDGRFAWVLQNVYRYTYPILATGALGLWEWENTIEEATKPAQMTFGILG